MFSADACIAVAVQIENAKERLVATFVEGTDLGVGRGGQATTQDLVRMLLCARVACSLDSKRAQELVAVGSGVAPLKPGAREASPVHV